MQIQLSWPNKALSPNARVHFYTLSRAKKAAKHEGHGATLAAMSGGNAPKWSNERFSVGIAAYPPVKRTRDADNLVASLKAQLDGIALALGVDDSRFDLRPVQWGEPVPNGKIVITLEAA